MRVLLIWAIGLGLATESAATTIVGISLNGDVYEIDSRTGGGTLVGSSGVTVNALAEHEGQFLTVSALGLSRRLISIDPATGVGTQIAEITGGRPNVTGMAIDASGTLFVIGGGGTFASNDEIWRIDIASGFASMVGVTSSSSLQALAFSPDGTLYGWAVGSVGLVTIDPLTAFLTDVNPDVGSSFGNVQTIDFAPDGTLFGARNDLFTIDVATGEGSLVGSGGYSDLRGIAFVPEPATATLLGLGLCVLGVRPRSFRSCVPGE